MGSIITVSQLNRYISFKLKEDIRLQNIFIRGEISNFTNHIKTGHFYFTLKDKDGSIKAIMFNNFAARLGFLPENGMSVICFASVQVFERDGLYQLYVTDIQPDGVGALYIKVEQLKEKLMSEGIFDEKHKKQLPAYPNKIGIVTSPDAAALQDILNIITRRYPIAKVTVFSCTVQGGKAEDSVCYALRKADKSGQNLIILTRGGGSLEDLAAFNSEAVAREIFKCSTPVISAVGHETDNTVSDLTADLRAPTPSAAAELAVPDINSITELLHSSEKRLQSAFASRLYRFKHILGIKEKQINSLLPFNRINTVRLNLKSNEEQLNNVFKRKLLIYNAMITEKTAVLEGLSPLKILGRGYSVVYNNGKLVKSSSEITSNDIITVRFSDGEISAVVR